MGKSEKANPGKPGDAKRCILEKGTAGYQRFGVFNNPGSLPGFFFEICCKCQALRKNSSIFTGFSRIFSHLGRLNAFISVQLKKSKKRT
jgi:hypothetical protein